MGGGLGAMALRISSLLLKRFSISRSISSKVTFFGVPDSTDSLSGVSIIPPTTLKILLNPFPHALPSFNAQCSCIKYLPQLSCLLQYAFSVFKLIFKDNQLTRG
mmetsp:Transcript_24024/g.42674  ORF Transcript_24024/g.42674 Transcript_24024/m.42674 type:complete len:104 (+) Transcript_24024:2421-2732(+)